MAESPRLTSQDFDPWHQASPRQLLELLKRLGVEGRVIARWLGVTDAAVSQWTHDKRPIPQHFGPALLLWTRDAMNQAWQRNAKNVAAQPTEALQRAVQAELAAVYDRWKLEVLTGAGTLQKVIQQQCENFGGWGLKETITTQDCDDMLQGLDQLRHFVELWKMTGAPEAPDPEQQLLDRLTQAREDAGPIVLTPEERAAAEVDMPDVLAPEP
jgi:hypothetical protein